MLLLRPLSRAVWGTGVWPGVCPSLRCLRPSPVARLGEPQSAAHSPHPAMLCVCSRPRSPGNSGDRRAVFLGAVAAPGRGAAFTGSQPALASALRGAIIPFPRVPRTHAGALPSADGPRWPQDQRHRASWPWPAAPGVGPGGVRAPWGASRCGAGRQESGVGRWRSACLPACLSATFGLPHSPSFSVLRDVCFVALAQLQFAGLCRLHFSAVCAGSLRLRPVTHMVCQRGRGHAGHAGGLQGPQP